MDKQILYQYIDACELVKETEEEIERLRRRRRETVTDKVRMSDYDFPFGEISCTIHGVPYDALDHDALDRKEHILEERKAAAEAIKLQVEEWLVTVPLRMQRITKYKIFEGMTWEQVAARMGRKATGEGIRKEFVRFMAEK
ncbi:RNA polymerase subunit sigma-70 [Lachnoclostridium sp. An14]|uniref:RNA polymerase subunit sigma-70 n=1 Tax=Lachnoclostridium sp. An14 TaxID=1965562 RepID=UPI000B385D56|nr:RNA polymerase subunit sigma-70 [Lachnoclostridium sp. An14]OUQ10585.1 RNA polymerase subunit sigma-70 [Lachnoclostridium sp. An14]